MRGPVITNGKASENATQVGSVWGGASEGKGTWREGSGEKATHNLKFNISLPLKISCL